MLGVPLIAGLSFEVIKWAGRNRGKGWVQTLMWPGMQLQKMTTREPELDQLAVACAAMEAVLAVEDPRAASPRTRWAWRSSLSRPPGARRLAVCGVNVVSR